MKNKVDHKELLREQLKKLADKVDAVDGTEAAYIAGRLDAALTAEQLKTEASK